MSEFPITILDTDFVVEFSTRITSEPFAGRWPDLNSPGEPPEPGEFQVEVEHLRRDVSKTFPNGRGAQLEIPMWLRNPDRRPHP